MVLRDDPTERIDDLHGPTELRRVGIYRLRLMPLAVDHNGILSPAIHDVPAEECPTEILGVRAAHVTQIDAVHRPDQRYAGIVRPVAGVRPHDVAPDGHEHIPARVDVI